MSSNSECEIVQVTVDTWYYLLETSQSNLFDNWREMALCQGPFASEAQATEHLRYHHSNPGGHCVLALEPGEPDLDLDKDPVLKEAIEDAVAPDPRCGCPACQDIAASQ